MNISLDEWFALADKIDMIPNDELACNMRDIYMSIEVMRLRGMNNTSDEQRQLKNAIDFVLSKNNKDKGNKMNIEKFNELVKTINDNIDMLNYMVSSDGKLILVAECNDGREHLVRVWDNIQSHDDIIDKRLANNMNKQNNGDNK